MKTRLVATAVAAFVCLAAAGCGASNGTDTPPTTAADVPDEFFGVVPQTPIVDEDIARMAQGNIGVLRLVLPWGLMDPTEEDDDDVNFGFADAIILGAAQHGIRVIPTLYGTPDWVAQDIDGFDCTPTCANYAPRSPEAIKAFAEFTTELVERYGPEGELWKTNPDVNQLPVRSWQIWNEQNSPTFYEPEVDPQAYAALVEAAADSIHKRDPEAELILGGMFGTPFQGKPPAIKANVFLRDMYAIDGADETFDAVAAHPYAPHEAKIEQQVKLLHDEVMNANDDASLWITEVGASSDEGSNPLERGPEGQAELLRDAMEYFVEKREEFNIEGVTWYSWRDLADDSQCDWCPGSGLFEAGEPGESLESKPAWQALMSFTGGS
jgi:hypothetical protein